MVRIVCNICKEYKNIKSESYERMLKRFGFTRSFIFGFTHGIEAVVRNKPIIDEIDREKTEQAFTRVYVCKECRNNKKETIKITQSISRVLNLPKEGEQSG